MTITYSPWIQADTEKIAQLVQALYAEDVGSKPMTLDKIYLTFKTFINQPDLGKILVIKHETEIIGYTILVNFWSNEFGGIILNIDEIYLQPKWRSRGIATQLITYLAQTKFHNCVALELVVNPENVLAKKLYHKLGFKKYGNDTLLMDFS